MRSPDNFADGFKTLTGHDPFPWQRALFATFLAKQFPSACDLPTGLGKTSIIGIWLLALAHHVRADTMAGFPRRLIYVVNRRTVVDQATAEVESMRRALTVAPALRAVADALRSLRAEPSDSALSISTLRGQFADNAEWRQDPACAAVVTGTVDMIGSRLLFSGYGCGFRSRPLHAGFLGQDVLLVHDEAHLEPAFQQLIDAIEHEQRRCGDIGLFRVLALTATSRAHTAPPFGLTDADLTQADIRKRVFARKGLTLQPVAHPTRLADDVYRLAMTWKDSRQAIVIFLRRVEDVERVAAMLDAAGLSVASLTGTLRGRERDALTTHEVFRRFLPRVPGEPRPEPEHTAFLVCTSAGEVGVNISGDHLICDLATFDSMVQRLGRVNRFGEGDAVIHVLYGAQGNMHRSRERPAPGSQARYDEACERTLTLLQQLPLREDGRHDASSAALLALPADDRRAAFTPPPIVPATTDLLFDAWALTSIREAIPGRPAVANWLHGIADWEPPNTYVAWREEVKIISTDDLKERYLPQALLDDYPLKPHEWLRDRTSRVVTHLEAIAARCPNVPVWIVDATGEVTVRPLRDFAAPKASREAARTLEECTILLPPKAGGLKKGLLNGSAAFDRNELYDVSDLWDIAPGVPARVRIWDDAKPEGMRLVRRLDVPTTTTDDEASTATEGDQEHQDEEADGRSWRWFVRPRLADDDGSLAAQQRQELEPHHQRTAQVAAALAEKLRLGAPERQAVCLAAQWHDLGKARMHWQRSIGNVDYPACVLAKSDARARTRELNRCRHEFGSLLDISRLDAFHRLTPDVQDLVLHLVAAHHGRARPHFGADEAFDPDGVAHDVLEMARDVPVRFARLQRRYGRWGLAYLESVVRAADITASQSPASSSVVVSEPRNTIALPTQTRVRRSDTNATDAAIRVRVDPANPGQFLACCGLLELASRVTPQAEGRFERGIFTIKATLTLPELLEALTRTLPVEMTHVEHGPAIPALIAPLKLSLGEEARPLTLDAWMKIRVEQGEVLAAANPPWNFWSGQQTSLRIWTALRQTLRQQMASNRLGAQGGLDLFVHRVPLSGRFGFDPGAAWNTLDAGFSPNEQGMAVASSPAVELLAAVGLQRFRPIVDGASFDYFTWGQFLPPDIAAVAASGAVVIPAAACFRGCVVSRGSYAALGYSTYLQGVSE